MQMVVNVPGGVRREDPSHTSVPRGAPGEPKELASTNDESQRGIPKKEPTKEELIKGLLKPLPVLSYLKKKATDSMEDKGLKFVAFSQQPISDKFDLSEGVSVVEGSRTRSNFRANPMSMTSASDFSKNNKITKKAYAMMMTQQGAFSSNSINETLQEKRVNSEKRLTFGRKQFAGGKSFGQSGQTSSLPVVGQDGNQSQVFDGELETLREDEKSKKVHVESGKLLRSLLEKGEDEEEILKGGKKKEERALENTWVSGNDEFNRGLVENRTEGGLNKVQKQFKISEIPKSKMERSAGNLLKQTRHRGNTAGSLKTKLPDLNRLPPPKMGRTFGHGFFEQST